MTYDEHLVLILKLGVIATQQVWENYDMWLKKEWLTGVDSQKAVVKTMPKASKHLSRLQHLKSGTLITPSSPLRSIDLTNKTN
jgi:hypothetical protein